MTTIDHLSLGVTDVPAARAFYGRVLDVLGVRCLSEGEGFAAFGRDRAAFLLLTPFDGGPASAGNGAHVAFTAPDREAVARAHAAGLDAGAIDEGAPGVRAAYLRDPWGNKIELVHGGFSA